MTTVLAHEVAIWKLEREGACGVGDHSRGFVRNLGGRVVELGHGAEMVPGPQLLQYVPHGWDRALGWAGALSARLDDASEAQRTLFLHEARRRPSWRVRSWGHWASDLLALRVLLPRVARVVVTTERRAAQVLELMRRWRLDRPVGVVGVASNVHASDPDGAPDVPTGSEVAIFARSGGGVLARALASTVAELLRRRRDVRVVLLGARTREPHDEVLSALKEREVLDRVDVVGAAAASDVAARMGSARVGLALHDTGVSGRRGTVMAMLATGLPLVSARGVDTDGWLERTSGVILATEARKPDASALADALLQVVDEPVQRALERRHAASATYLQHAGWSALGRVLEGRQ
ncbi:MAG: glycosyltransferase [Myxococcota bacterium]